MQKPEKMMHLAASEQLDLWTLPAKIGWWEYGGEEILMSVWRRMETLQIEQKNSVRKVP